MEKSEIKGFIAKRCAKELKDGDVVNLGIGLPTLIPHYLPEGVELIIHAELGIVSAGKAPKEGDENYDPYHVVDAGGSPASVAYGGGFIDSASNFGLIRGGHVDACFLGALEVDAEGTLKHSPDASFYFFTVGSLKDIEQIKRMTLALPRSASCVVLQASAGANRGIRRFANFTLATIGDLDDLPLIMGVLA